MGLEPEYVVSKGNLVEAVKPPVSEGIAAGSYTDIIGIYGPSEAAQGETVDITVRVKNTWTSSFRVYCVGVLDSETRFIDWQDAIIAAGETHDFTGSFSMPARDVVINTYTYFKDAEGNLHEDDSRSARLNLKEYPSPEFRGFGVNEYTKR